MSFTPPSSRELIVSSYFEEQYKAYPSGGEVKLVGLCTGLIAATAVASANSLTALIPLAIESIRIAFRTGAHVARVAQHLEGNNERQSWSTILAADEKVAQSTIDAFHLEHVSRRSVVILRGLLILQVLLCGP